MAKQAKPVHIKLEEYRDQFVALIPTEKDAYHPQGIVYKVHPDVAKMFVKEGKAEYAAEGAEEGDEIGVDDTDYISEEDEEIS